MSDAEREHVADGEWTRQAPHPYEVDTEDGAPCCPFDRGHPIHRQAELPAAVDHLADPTPPEPDRPGCEACSYADGGCSFCSGRSAIEVANERADMGVAVVDLSDVMAFQQRVADQTRAEGDT